MLTFPGLNHKLAKLRIASQYRQDQIPIRLHRQDGITSKRLANVGTLVLQKIHQTALHDAQKHVIGEERRFLHIVSMIHHLSQVTLNTATKGFGVVNFTPVFGIIRLKSGRNQGFHHPEVPNIPPRREDRLVAEKFTEHRTPPSNPLDNNFSPYASLEIFSNDHWLAA
jgi:hypothetical protein